MYYALIMLSVVMFGGCFALSDVYRKMRGSSIKISMESSVVGSLSALAIMICINGFAIEITAFTLIMAFFDALNGMLFTFCSFRALDYINLSLYSLFSMLGGMLLPFFQGILLYGEEFTLSKIVCVISICASLALTFEGGAKKGGAIFYLGVFVLNGMSGVLTKIFTTADFPKASAASYSALSSICAVVMSGIVLLALVVTDRRRQGRAKGSVTVPKKTLLKSYGIVVLKGGINRVANYILVFSLAFVDASVQYPMVTGGTMIVSTLLCFFGDRKPSKKEIISTLLAFVGLLVLFIAPA